MGQSYASSYLRHNEEQRDGEKRRQSRKENTKAAQVFSLKKSYLVPNSLKPLTKDLV